MTLCDEPTSKQKHKYKHKHKHKIHESKVTRIKKTHNHKHRDRVRPTIHQTSRQKTWKKEREREWESKTDRKLWKKEKKYSLISLCLTHIYCYSFILHVIFVCLQYAICWYIRYVPHHKFFLSFFLSFWSKFSFLILRNCIHIYGRSNEKKQQHENM